MTATATDESHRASHADDATSSAPPPSSSAPYQDGGNANDTGEANGVSERDRGEDRGEAKATSGAGGGGGGAEVKEEYITTLNPNDVLCGRGSGPNDHTGNVMFRRLINTRKSEYLATSSRQTKAKIAQEIVDHVRKELSPAGRFLKKVEGKALKEAGFKRGDEVWTHVDEDTALEKAKQALRQNRAASEGRGSDALGVGIRMAMGGGMGGGIGSGAGTMPQGLYVEGGDRGHAQQRFSNPGGYYCDGGPEGNIYGDGRDHRHAKRFSEVSTATASSAEAMPPPPMRYYSERPVAPTPPPPSSRGSDAVPHSPQVYPQRMPRVSGYPAGSRLTPRTDNLSSLKQSLTVEDLAADFRQRLQAGTSYEGNGFKYGHSHPHARTHPAAPAPPPGGPYRPDHVVSPPLYQEQHQQNAAAQAAAVPLRPSPHISGHALPQQRQQQQQQQQLVTSSNGRHSLADSGDSYVSIDPIPIGDGSDFSNTTMAYVKKSLGEDEEATAAKQTSQPIVDTFPPPAASSASATAAVVDQPTSNEVYPVRKIRAVRDSTFGTTTTSHLNGVNPSPRGTRMSAITSSITSSVMSSITSAGDMSLSLTGFIEPSQTNGSSPPENKGAALPGQIDESSKESSSLLADDPRPIALLEEDPDTMSYLGTSSMSVMKCLNTSSDTMKLSLGGLTSEDSLLGSMATPSPREGALRVGHLAMMREEESFRSSASRPPSESSTLG